MNIRSTGGVTRLSIGMLAAFALAATACGSDDNSSSGASTAGTTGASAVETGSTAKSGDGPSFIYITPTPIGVNKFLELGQIGTEASAKKLGGKSKVYESTDLNSRRANLEAAVEEKPDIIVLTTFEFTDLAAEFAGANPDQKFILIDSCPEAPPTNLHCGVFREQEGAYLLGVEAGLLTKTNKIGSVAALDIPFIHRYTDSFALGAKSVNPAVTDSQVFIAGDNPFSDPARGKEQADALIAQGLDNVFAVGAGSNGGIFDAAKAAGVLAYGVDVNECPTAPGTIVDNNLKFVDAVVEQLIDQVLDGSAGPIVSFGLKEKGMGVIALQDDVAASGCVIADHPDVIEKVKAAAAQIIDGSLVVPDPLTAG